MSRAARNGRREHCGQHGHVGGRREQNNEVGDHGIHRLSEPLLQRLDEVHTQSLTCEPILCTMREAITDFRRQAVVAELIT